MPIRIFHSRSSRRIVSLVALVVCMIGAWPVHAQINMWEDEEGVLILDSRRAPRGREAMVLSDHEIETKPLPADADIEEFRRLYSHGASILNEILTDLRYNTFNPANRARLITFKNYLNIKAPDLNLPPGAQHRIASLRGAARVAGNMIEGQRDPDTINRLQAKSLFCDMLATKVRWDIWIMTYEAPIDIVDIDDSLCVQR
ncbi:hypothetical protein DPQ33_13015 [Oceanidesulfovibrio indonesiensis]|uniref:Uncharacterized protein n=1 Tax=Oceanidesulfovibrio indonesiensis TaxID=54767 RepID=A0A7M3MCP1_9BACT|nr:hypothetical protein [Oceanidesulfovibrio indonesiensis]TVM16235.1 hypothetical protein DPQ33_13015 [Oceanidesulfovibrio indonesiensis]